MPGFVVRVWLPDRPGALGAVASRIGAVRGDVVGIEILERGGGRAVDELVVELADPALVPLMVQEIGQVDGVDVEDVRPLAGRPGDPRLEALETALALVEQEERPELLSLLVERTGADCDADWAAVVDSSTALAWVGPVPAPPWLIAFVAGARTAPDEHRRGEEAPSVHQSDPVDVAWAEMAPSALVLVVGRAGRPFRARERRQLEAVAHLGGRRWAEIGHRPAPALHPSGAG
jgi:hypothetical protein